VIRRQVGSKLDILEPITSTVLYTSNITTVSILDLVIRVAETHQKQARAKASSQKMTSQPEDKFVELAQLESVSRCFILSLMAR
jgi:hypothetical protein